MILFFKKWKNRIVSQSITFMYLQASESKSSSQSFVFICCNWLCVRVPTRFRSGSDHVLVQKHSGRMEGLTGASSWSEVCVVLQHRLLLLHSGTLWHRSFESCEMLSRSETDLKTWTRLWSRCYVAWFQTAETSGCSSSDCVYELSDVPERATPSSKLELTSVCPHVGVMLSERCGSVWTLDLDVLDGVFRCSGQKYVNKTFFLFTKSVLYSSQAAVWLADNVNV